MEKKHFILLLLVCSVLTGCTKLEGLYNENFRNIPVELNLQDNRYMELETVKEYRKTYGYLHVDTNTGDTLLYIYDSPMLDYVIEVVQPVGLPDDEEMLDRLKGYVNFSGKVKEKTEEMEYTPLILNELNACEWIWSQIPLPRPF